MFEPENFRWTLCGFAFVFGALWGSFLNVVIYRVPAGLSVIRPASRCPVCETPIRAYDNIPVVSWLVLRGKCRDCATPISARYPLIELSVAILALLLALHVFTDRRIAALVAGEVELTTLLTPWIFLFAWVCALVALFWIDLDITELPPEITIPAIAVGLLYAWLVPEIGLFYDLVPNPSLLDSIVGTLIGGGLILGLILGYYLLTGRIGLGFGDVWMMGMVGAFVGWQGLFFVYLASSVQGILVAALAVGWAKLRGDEEGANSLFRNDEVAELERELRVGSDDDDEGPAPDEAEAEPADEGFGKLAVPFGPFIAVAAVEFIFVGEPVMKALMGPAAYTVLH